MYKLLIIDDERNIRIGLKAMIEREYPSLYSIRLAAGGVEALELYRDERADMIITDIRMPGMDGLELIQELNRSPLPPAVVILSGYDDFQYAKEAITYRVREYLLKPIVREELYQALNRITDDLKQEHEVNQELEKLNKYKDEQAADQLNYIFLHPDIPELEIRSRCAKAGLHLLTQPYVTGVIQGEPRQDSDFKKLWAEHFTGENSIAFTDKDRNLVVITSDESLFTDFIVYAQEKRLHVGIGVSAVNKEPEKVKHSYFQAKQALKYQILQAKKDASIYYYKDVNHLTMPQGLPEEEIRRLANLLGTGRKQEIQELWHCIFNVQTIKRHNISYLEQLSRLVNELVFDQVFTSYGEASVEILKSYKKIGYLYHSETISDYIHDAEDLLLRLDGYIKDIKEAHIGHAEMKAAIEYIGQNYDKPLNMATVSNHVSLNYSYFSETFKHFTGMSFVPYLKKVRIDKAKDLLEETHRKVYEIADQVGFENVKQFNRVFRELEGVSPMEYREKTWIHFK
ncbi:response regulator [Paenibacillus sp. HJL G12]|uniref:Response regulator n=1 Tax=Paenibacillus dendrobii TaxID=2691084 RepID=A0A7X3IK30_9BACL|nr:response regulator [Paenibacillus dendrobii]MWV45393.1 response regulator [Paenibacillus dendrobii]